MTWNLEYFSSMDVFFRIHGNVCGFALHDLQVYDLGDFKKNTIKNSY